MQKKLLLIFLILPVLTATNAALALNVDMNQVSCFAKPSLELYKDENFAAFPCDLSSGEKPVIMVVGEVHDYVSDDANVSEDLRAKSQASMQFWQIIAGMHLNNQAIMSGEELMVGRSGDYVSQDRYQELLDSGYYLGLDDGFAKAITVLPTYWIMAQEQLRSLNAASDLQIRTLHLKNYRNTTSLILDAFWKSPFLQSVWKSIPRPLTEASQEKWAKFLDNYACDENGLDATDNILAELDVQSLQAIHQLFQVMIRALPTLIQSVNIHQVDVDKARLSSVLTAIADDAGTTVSKYMEMERILSPLRESLMAANLGKLYCALRKYKRPVFVQVGESHVEPLVKRLTEMAQASKLDASRIRQGTTYDLLAKLQAAEEATQQPSH